MAFLSADPFHVLFWSLSSLFFRELAGFCWYYSVCGESHSFRRHKPGSLPSTVQVSACVTLLGGLSRPPSVKAHSPFEPLPRAVLVFTAFTSLTCCLSTLECAYARAETIAARSLSTNMRKCSRNICQMNDSIFLHFHCYCPIASHLSTVLIDFLTTARHPPIFPRGLFTHKSAHVVPLLKTL